MLCQLSYRPVPAERANPSYRRVQAGAASPTGAAPAAGIAATAGLRDRVVSFRSGRRRGLPRREGREEPRHGPQQHREHADGDVVTA